MQEKLGAIDLAMTAADLREIEDGYAALVIEGARTTAALLERSDLGARPGTSSAGGIGLSPLPADRRPGTLPERRPTDGQ